MNQLYLECYSGISGDMFVASLLDLGSSKEVLEEVLSSLPLTGFKTEITRVNKSGLDVCDFNVVLDHDNHDHDMNYLYGKQRELNSHRLVTDAEFQLILAYRKASPEARAIIDRIVER